MPESPDFDPYLKWLGIRDSTRPVNHYRLLGLDLYESDPDVISMAADRQMAHIRTYQNGPNGDLSQQILSELARARRCLLMAEKKATYDQQLKSALNPDRVPPGPLPLATPVNQPPAQGPVNHRFPPNHSVPVVHATHPPANFQPGDSIEPPTIPVISPTVSSSRNQRPSRKQAVGRQSNIGIRADDNARKKIQRRERKQLVWTLVSWVSGGVAAVGVAAYLIGAGFVPSPFQARVNDSPETIAPDAGDSGSSFGKSKNSPARSKPKDLTKKNRTNDKANQVVWNESEIKAYPKPGEKTVALVNKIDRAVKRGKTIRFEPSLIEGGDRETVVVPKPARLVIGFAYTTHQDGKIRDVQPVLLDKRLAYVAGRMGNDPSAKYVVAKPGYAVGAVKLSRLNPMNCFRITFMKIAEDGLDPNDSYLSLVHGLNSGPLKSVSNESGLPIVGVYSRSKGKTGIATLGLVGVDFSVARGFDSRPINRDRYKPKSDLRFGSAKNKPDAKKPLFPPRKKSTAEVAKKERGKSGFGIAKNAMNRPAWFGEAFGNDVADAAPEKKAKLPVPGKRERDRAAKAMKGDYTQAVSAAFASGRVRDVAILGERMINDSQSENMRVVAKYALLEQARELTMMVGEVETAIKIVREMDTQFDVDFWDVAYTTLHDGARNINKVPRDRIALQVKFRQTMRGLIDEAIEKRLYNEAGRLATYAVVLAARHNDPNLAATRRLGKDIDELRLISTEAQRLAQKFKESPDDPGANEAFGKYLFVVEDDFDSALKHWEKAEDELMVKIAKTETQIDQAARADAKKLVALGDLWRLLGKSNKSMFQRKALERAVDIYNRASFKLDQTDQADAEDKKAAIKRLLRN